jgi:hypothetical protein
MWLRLDSGLQLGLAPQPSASLGVAVGVRSAAKLSLELAAARTFSQQHRAHGGLVTFNRDDLLLEACPWVLQRGAMLGQLCSQARVARLRALAEGFALNGEGVAWLAHVGVGVGLQHEWRSLVARVAAGALLPLRRVTVTLLEEPRDAVLYAMPPVAGFVSVGVGLRWGG